MIASPTTPALRAAIQAMNSWYAERPDLFHRRPRNDRGSTGRRALRIRAGQGGVEEPIGTRSKGVTPALGLGTGRAQSGHKMGTGPEREKGCRGNPLIYWWLRPDSNRGPHHYE